VTQTPWSVADLSADLLPVNKLEAELGVVKIQEMGYR